MKSGEGDKKVWRRKPGASKVPGRAHLPLLGLPHQNRRWGGLPGDSWKFVSYLLLALSVGALWRGAAFQTSPLTWPS